MLNRLFFIGLLVISTFSIAAPEPVKLAPPKLIEKVKIVSSLEKDDPTHSHFSRLLLAVLKVTEEDFGQLQIQQVDTDIVQERAMQELQEDGGLDVFWTITSRSREEMSIPVRFPLVNGLYGYRVAFIHKDDFDKFQSIKSESQLKKLVAGQGHDWPDLKILMHNNYRAISTSNYANIIELLRKRRIDYFPRGVGEILREEKFYGDGPFVIEPNLLLYYPSYMYFFVNKQKPQLAKRIRIGLERLEANGKFQALLAEFIDFNELNTRLKLKSRRIFELVNPELSEQSNFRIPPFWE